MGNIAYFQIGIKNKEFSSDSSHFAIIKPIKHIDFNIPVLIFNVGICTILSPNFILKYHSIGEWLLSVFTPQLRNRSEIKQTELGL